MMTLKAVETLFITTRLALFQKREDPRKNSRLFLCKGKESDSEPPAPPPEGGAAGAGDTRKQELLARIAMLQAQKVRLTDYLDERSAFLTQFAEEAGAEFDQIGENAMKDIDEASARIMENIETRMQAFEESAEISKQEIWENERKLDEFEIQLERDINEGLFFKNLTQNKLTNKDKATGQREKMTELTKENAGSKTRRNIYLGLIGIVIFSIIDSLVFSSSSDWRKVGILGAILVGLLSQLTG